MSQNNRKDLDTLIYALRESIMGGAAAGASGLWGWGMSYPGPEPGKMRELGANGWGMWSLPAKAPPKRLPGREREERTWHRKL